MFPNLLSFKKDMKRIGLGLLLNLLNILVFAQHPICLTSESAEGQRQHQQVVQGGASSVSIVKIVRVNIHFMLKSNGTGNFNEINDGDLIQNTGPRPYSGYDFAFDHVKWMNERNSWNVHMNIPTGNTTPVNDKNYYFILDAVYFHRDDATYYFQAIDPSLSNLNYSILGNDPDNVLNIFLTNTANTGSGGYASSVGPGTNYKYTENKGYWERYMQLYHPVPSDPPDDFSFVLHGTGQQSNHELGHLLGLLHTVRKDVGGNPCPAGCPNLPPPYGSGTIDFHCGDDGCLDTPTAWEITAANACTKHPACIWGDGDKLDCSNNLMDYTGDNALTPCQINIIHSSLEGGMRSYTACNAVTTDRSYCDLAYPRVTYFGKNVSVGMCPGTVADVTSKEKLAVWFSGSLELGQFEVKDHSEFEAVFHNICLF
jgi:hypothetical protein